MGRGIGDVLVRLGDDAVARLLHEGGQRDDDRDEHENESSYGEPVLFPLVFHSVLSRRGTGNYT